MKVKTDYVPEDCDYLTAGKIYNFVETDGYHGLGRIVSDAGKDIVVYIYSSVRIGGRPWDIVEE